MPLKLNVGASRKIIYQNYGSRGASVHLEIELESAIITDPAKLQERIRQVFGLVRSSLNEELNGVHHGENQAPPTNTAAPPAQNGHASNGRKPANSRPATSSQVRAIIAIARQQKVDLAALFKSDFTSAAPTISVSKTQAISSTS